jgi:Phosphotransferase enzyme family
VTAIEAGWGTAEDAARAVRTAAREAVGREVELAGAPQVSVADGRGAYVCRLAGEPARPWDGELVVRVCPGGADVARREAAWHDLAAAGAVAVPAVLAVGAVAAGAGAGSALVLERGPGRTLIECMAANVGRIPELVTLLGELHARIHALPAGGVPAGGVPAVPTASPLDDLDRTLASVPGGDRFAPQLDVLRRGAGDGTHVVCHGDFQPSAVRVDPGDVAGAVVTNWSSARLAEREYDVALTILMFWSAPYLAPGRGQRKLLKTVREMLIDGYRAAYERHATLSDERLRHWGAFHALAWQVRMAAPPPAHPDPWDPTGLVSFPDGYRRDLARRVSRLTQR